MSQATTWSVPLVGPATPTLLTQRIDDSLDALLTGHSGSARPSYAVAGTVWQDTSVAGTVNFYMYDGSDDNLLWSVNTSTNVVTWAGGAFGGSVDFRSQTIINPAGLMLRGFIAGLSFANDTGGDVTNDFITSAGSAASDDAIPVLMTLASAMTKRTDAAWAAGSGNGGWLDGASMPNGTGHVFLIRNPTTGAVDVGVSASLSPTLPTGYTQKRRIHSAVLRESGALALVIQNGNTFTRSVRVQDVSAANPGTSAVTRTLSVPVGIVVTAFGDAQILVSSSSGAGFFALLTSLSQADSDPSTVGGTVSMTTLSSSTLQRSKSPFEVETNASAQIRSRLSASAAGVSLVIFTEGWVDTRGIF